MLLYPPPPMPGNREKAISPWSHGFTLIELLTVVAIIGMLVSILIPTVGMVQLKARQAKSSANLSSIGKALLLYTLDNNGLLPAPIFGTSSSPSNAPGSSNPRGGTWLEELVGPKYLGGTFTTNLGSSTGTVEDWPEVLTCPQFLAKNSVITDPDVRGYGMNPWLYRADINNSLYHYHFETQRQSLEKLPNHSNNIIIGTSYSTAFDWGSTESTPNHPDQMIRLGAGDSTRFGNLGLYLFLDGQVQALSPKDARNILNPASRH